MSWRGWERGEQAASPTCRDGCYGCVCCAGRVVQGIRRGRRARFYPRRVGRRGGAAAAERAVPLQRGQVGGKPGGGCVRGLPGLPRQTGGQRRSSRHEAPWEGGGRPPPPGAPDRCSHQPPWTWPSQLPSPPIFFRPRLAPIAWGWVRGGECVRSDGAGRGSRQRATRDHGRRRVSSGDRDRGRSRVLRRT